MNRLHIVWLCFGGMLILAFLENFALIARCASTGCNVSWFEAAVFQPLHLMRKLIGINGSETSLTNVLVFLWPSSLVTLIVAAGLKKIRHPLSIVSIVILALFILVQLVLLISR